MTTSCGPIVGPPQKSALLSRMRCEQKVSGLRNYNNRVSQQGSGSVNENSVLGVSLKGYISLLIKLLP
jgi:hypothetical protein